MAARGEETKGKRLLIGRAPGRIDLMGGAGSYTGSLVLQSTTAEAACQNADKLLLKIGDQAVLNKECASSTFGKLTPEALYVHVDFLDGWLRDFEPGTRAVGPSVC